MNTGLFVVLSLLGLSIMGIPIAFALGLGVLGALYMSGMPLIVIPQKMFCGITSVPLLAVPFFMLAGNLMAGGINNRILSFSNAILGWVKGSLGVVTVFASAIFAAISGSGVATVSAIGGITIPAMKKEGYPSTFAAAISSVASILGPLIPPSIFLIVYGSATETSIAQLFLGALIPGFTLAVLLALYVFFVAKKNNFASHEWMGTKAVIKETKGSIWALFMPFLILGGIFLGIFTATEAAAISAVYALVVGMFIYKDLKWKNLMSVFSESAVTAAIILLMLATSKASSWVIVTSHLPDEIISLFFSITHNPIIIMLFINCLLLVVGMLMEANAAIIMLTPLLLPLIKTLGISPIHFGIIMALNLCVGLVTPPVGACLYLGNSIAGEKLDRTLKASLPMIIICLGFLLVVTFVPALSTWLPNLMK